MNTRRHLQRYELRRELSAVRQFSQRTGERPRREMTVAPRSDASSDFRTALSALNAGDHSHAAALFTSFLSNHPRDARIEDAAYLRVIAFHRSGDKSATERAAGEYLKRFPNGFRRTEVEALE